jgi:hypothetical protein
MEVTSILLPASHVRPLSGRTPIPSHIIGVQSYAAGRKVVGKAGIEAAVIAEPVEVDQQSSRPGRAPAPIKELKLSVSGKSTFTGFRHRWGELWHVR